MLNDNRTPKIVHCYSKSPVILGRKKILFCRKNSKTGFSVKRVNKDSKHSTNGYTWSSVAALIDNQSLLRWDSNIYSASSWEF